MNEQEIPKNVKKRLEGWFTTFWAFTICHYLFGIGGVFASTMVAAAPDTATSRVYGIISAICIAFIGFIQPDQKYRKYVVAWRMLDEKVNLYRHGLIKIDELIAGMTAAEKALDQIERETASPRTSNPQQPT